MAQRLMGVVNGLQLLEDNFLKVLMEAALKLASLTDVRLFILCETAEGRRFAGDGDLCDLYRNGMLQPQVADVEMEINASPSGIELKEKPSNSRCSGEGGDAERDGGGDVLEAPSNDSPTVIEDTDIIPLTVTSCRKRPSGDLSSSWPNNKARRRSSHSHLPFSHLGESFDNSLSAPSLSLDDHVNWDEYNQPVDVKAFNCELPDERVGVAASNPDQSNDVQRLNGAGERRRFSSSSTPRRAASFSAYAGSPETENSVAITNFDLKVEALKQITGDKFEQTNSDEFRLMSSCMYEFGRNTAEKYMQCLQGTPDFPHRPFFIQEYEHWAAQFVNIHPFGNIMIKKENRESKRTLTAYMRKIAGDAFGICIRKKMKKQNLFLPKSADPYNSIGLNSGLGSYDHSLPFDSSDILS